MYNRFKNFQFPGAGTDMCKEAYNYLRRNYENNYAPKLEPEPEPLDKNVRPPKKKMKKTALSVFLDDSEEEDDLPLTELIQ